MEGKVLVMGNLNSDTDCEPLGSYGGNDGDNFLERVQEEPVCQHVGDKGDDAPLRLDLLSTHSNLEIERLSCGSPEGNSDLAVLTSDVVCEEEI